MGSGASGVEYLLYHFGDSDISRVHASLADSSGNHYTLGNSTATGVIFIKTDSSSTVQGSVHNKLANSQGAPTIDISSDESQIIAGGIMSHIICDTSDMSVDSNGQLSTTAYWGGSFPCHTLFAGGSTEYAFVLNQGYSTSVSTSSTTPMLTRIDLSDNTFDYRKFFVSSSSDTNADLAYGRPFGKDSDGNIYLLAGLAQDSEHHIFKVDADHSQLNVLWDRSMPWSTFTGDHRYTLSVNSSGDSFFGFGDGTLNIESLDSSGTSQWRKSYSGGSLGIRISGSTVGRNSLAVGDVYIIAARRESGNGCQLFAVNQSDGSVAWYLDVADGSTGNIADENVGLNAHPTGNAFTLCTGRVMLQLPADGSITGTYSTTGGNVVISSLTNPTTVTSVTSTFVSDSEYGIRTDQTSNFGWSNNATATISDPDKEAL